MANITITLLVLVLGVAVCRAETTNNVDTSFRMKKGICSQPRFLGRFRTINGFCNNQLRPFEGSAGSVFVVQAAPLRSIRDTANLPSARLISNIVNDEARPKPNRRGMSELVTYFGQILDHTITNTDTNRHSPLHIRVPPKDPVFRANSSIPFFRTISRGTGNRRAPVNMLSSFIDAACVYGTNANLAKRLRLLRGGLLRLPKNQLMPGKRGKFLAGDDRASENPNLAALHLLFAREHNTVAAEIAAAFPLYKDEQIYQLARHIVAAEMQAITYHEFLPALTGSKLPPYRRYNPLTHSAISTRFSTVAFRVGHTLLNSTVTTINARGVSRYHKLRYTFFNTSIFVNDGVDSFIRGMMRGHASEVDYGVTSEVRNFLITSQLQKRKVQLDLVALNIQRGRDNGVPSCNGVRRSISLRPFKSFEQISSDKHIVARLRRAYRNRIDDVDAWVCGVAEDKVRGSSLGPLFQRIIHEQFTRLRDGDRFYFERPGYFTPEEIRKLAIVRKLVGPKRELGNIMRSVIARNTRIPLREIKRDPFFV